MMRGVLGEKMSHFEVEDREEIDACRISYFTHFFSSFLKNIILNEIDNLLILRSISSSTVL